MGVEAELCLWVDRRITQRCSLHKGKVEAVSFSHCGRLLASIGGPDDNSLVIWEVETGKALCGAPVSASAVAFFNTDSERLATCGVDTSLYIWQLDRVARKLTKTSVQLGQCRRNFTALAISENDRFMFVGSTSGDVAEVSIGHKRLCRIGPPRRQALSAVSTLRCLPGGLLLVGGAEGRLIAVDTAQPEQQAAGKTPLFAAAEACFPDGISSIAVHPSSGEIVVGTKKSDMYRVGLIGQGSAITQELRHSAHSSAVHDVVFPHGCSDLIASCSYEEDGSSILVGLSDGTVRAHAPQSGKEQYIICEAHHTAVLALAVTPDGKTIITGDGQGFLRFWKIGANSQSMIVSLKEHKGAINRIQIGQRHPHECITASSDGSCILWDLDSLKRKCTFSASTFFKDVAWSADESQLVTAGTDRKLMYWDCYTGEAIRELKGSANEAILSAAVHPGGRILASGGADRVVKLWRYDEGDCCAVGNAHTGEVCRCVFSPDGKMLVTVDTHGALMFWDVPIVLDSSTATSAAAC
ncbi:g70 [Coccomyxa elongata]